MTLRVERKYWRPAFLFGVLALFLFVSLTGTAVQAQRVKNLMVPGLSVGSDLTSQQIGTAKLSKLVKRFGG